MTTRKRGRWVVLGGLALSALRFGTACEATADGDVKATIDVPASTLSPEDAALGCKALIDAYCSKLATCGPNFTLADYGDPALCNQYNQELCETDFLLPGTKLTRADLASCGAAIAAMTCDEFNTRGGWNACGFKGAAQDGAPCVLGSQCASGRCPGGNAKVCAKCVAHDPKNAGDDCMADDDCASGLVCAPDLTCATPVELGESCDDSTPCGSWLACEDGACVRVGHLDEPCGPNYTCASLDLACDDVNCVSYRVASEGESCSVEGEAIACKGGRCDLTTDKCVAIGALGAPCVNGACLGPAGCVDGVCTLFSADLYPCKD